MMNTVDSAVERILRQGVKDAVFSTGSAAWTVNGAPVSTIAADNGPQWIFDLASLTKLFTAAACLRLVSHGSIDIEAPLRTYLPRLGKRRLGEATIAQILRHRAGLVSWHPFFEQVPVNERGTDTARRAILDSIINHPLDTLPGETVQYSDLGFILLAHILESVSSRTFPDIVSREISVPLCLDSIHFRPLSRPPSVHESRIAPTETCPWRGGPLIGEVHDDNAWTMGGVAGHAGLFGTATDVAEFGAAWLETRSNDEWLDVETIRCATARHPTGRGLGWDFKTPGASSAGNLISETAFGHLGFTGCSLWVDPERNLSVSLLTNRVCFGRDSRKIRAFRPAFHDVLLTALFG